jgi:lipid-A-disaccharide synthase
MGEVQRLGGILADAAARIAAARPGIRFVTPLASARLRPVFEKQLAEAGIEQRFTLVDGQAQVVMSAADVVLQASGTAVLEAALLRKPAVAAYRLSPLTYWMGRYLFRVNLTHYTLPNLLTEEPLVPEFMQHEARPGPIADAVVGLLDDPARRRSISERFDKLREELALDADERAAAAVLELALR